MMSEKSLQKGIFIRVTAAAALVVRVAVLQDLSCVGYTVPSVSPRRLSSFYRRRHRRRRKKDFRSSPAPPQLVYGGKVCAGKVASSPPVGHAINSSSPTYLVAHALQPLLPPPLWELLHPLDNNDSSCRLQAVDAKSFLLGHLQTRGDIGYVPKHTRIEVLRYTDVALKEFFSASAQNSRCLRHHMNSTTECDEDTPYFSRVFQNNPNASEELCRPSLETPALQHTPKRVPHAVPQATTMITAVDAPRGQRLWRGEAPPRAAVCMTGSPRTMTRLESYQALQLNFLSAWGADAALFTLLKRPADAQKEQEVTRVLDEHLRPVRRAWYDPLSSVGEVCSGRHTLKEDVKIAQLRQWAQCWKLIVDEETEARRRPNGRQYSIFVKSRPDDFWFGPMLPYCAFSPRVAYQSAQMNRFSDQFFIVPRVIASKWFSIFHEFRRRSFINCKGGKDGAIKSQRGHTASLYDPDSNKPDFPFEMKLQELLMTVAHKQKIEVRLVSFPRILTRGHYIFNSGPAENTTGGNGTTSMNEGDARSKCLKFAWFANISECMELLLAR